MIPKMEVMPFEGLTVSVKTFHHPLLNREGTGPVLPAEKNYRRAFDFARGIVRMARPYFRRLFIAHRRIIRDKRAHGWRCGDEVDS